MSTVADSFYKTDSHRYQQPDGFYKEGKPVQLPVLVIQYQKNSLKRWVPFNVQTPWENWDVNWSKSEQACCYHMSGSGLWLPWVEYYHGKTKQPEGNQRHKDGVVIPRACRPAEECVEFHGKALLPLWGKNEGAPIWWDRRFVQIGKYIGKDWNKPAPVKDGEAFAKKCGYRVLDCPLIVQGTRNPFEASDFISFGDRPTEYCQICDDHLVSDSDSLCAHVTWCEDCSCWSGDGLSEHDGCDCYRTKPKSKSARITKA